MYLQRLQLTNFKSYCEEDITFSQGINCIVGNNGVGKTNLLDAVYYLSFCKSYINNPDSLNIHQGCDYFAVHGTYVGLMSKDISDETANQETKISCVARQGQAKQLKVNGKQGPTITEHIGRIPLVMVSPNDQMLIIGGSDMRRRLLDGIISQTDSNYLFNLLQYNKALEQRNTFLKQCFNDRYLDKEGLELWDSQLVRYGIPIHECRKQFIEEFRPIFDQYFRSISSGVDSYPEMSYSSQLDGASFEQMLHEAHPRDAQLQFTTVGPHKDDLLFTIAGMPVRKTGSQGQQKTFLLSLKLAQFAYTEKMLHKKPLLLLDDMFDKLDFTRVQQLLTVVGGEQFGQVILTDTQQGRVEQLLSQASASGHSIYTIVSENGVSRVER